MEVRGEAGVPRRSHSDAQKWRRFSWRIFSEDSLASDLPGTSSYVGYLNLCGSMRGTSSYSGVMRGTSDRVEYLKSWQTNPLTHTLTVCLAENCWGCWKLLELLALPEAAGTSARASIETASACRNCSRSRKLLELLLVRRSRPRLVVGTTRVWLLELLAFGCCLCSRLVAALACGISRLAAGTACVSH
ncbi:hypothetical protein WN944_010147 [Citrus x changshan-huyou]|uniref:Uncharacterized protein n=1 Tax=Citrus x changshan-huyou TaxID=2935761 RepID=A0AAP0MVU8_9ROSI